MPTRSTVYPGGVQAMLRSPQMAAAMRSRAARVHQRAQQISPVRTGRYRASWHYRVVVKNGRVVGQVWNTAPYAAYLEYGTRHMKRQRILARSMAAIRR